MDNRIAVVDDEVINLTNIRMILGSEGFKVSCLRSGKDLFKFLEKNIPDLILLDIMMPDMDGFEVYHALREFEEKIDRAQVPVIFLTGDNDSETERRGLSAGASDFIHKPFDRDILLARIANTIEQSKTIESLAEEAAIDKLTGFLNKASGTDRIRELCGSNRGALLLFDLDNFKLVNDLYGHDCGDRVLVSFAEIMRENTRTGDVVSRIGGDEFLAFFPDMSDERAVASLSSRVNARLAEKCRELMGDDFDVPIGISCGASMVPAQGRDYENLFLGVDQALYKVKQGGKHGYGMSGASGVNDPGTVYPEVSDPEEEMERLTRIYEERGTGQEAMMLSSDAFSWCCRYIMRSVKKNGQSAGKIVFILKPANENADMVAAEAEFSDILKSVLRKVDIFTINKSCHFFAILPGLGRDETREMMDHIRKSWEKTSKAVDTEVRCAAGEVSFPEDEV